MIPVFCPFIQWSHQRSTSCSQPMAGSTGVLVPPKGYLEKLREKVLSVERGIVRALGSAEDVRRACS